MKFEIAMVNQASLFKPVQLHYIYLLVFVLFDLILYVPSTIFQLNREESSWVEPVLS